MSNTNIIASKYEMPSFSVKAQTVATVVAVALAMLLPQLVHMVGISVGTGSALGEIFLPMHLPVLLVGMIAGPYAALVTGMLAPVLSFVATGMPGMVMLPFITIELASYGLIAGAIRNARINTFIKVVIAQVTGRVVRSLAILIAVYVIGNSAVNISVIWTSVRVGIIGIMIQWVLIPAVVLIVRKVIDNERSAN